MVVIKQDEPGANDGGLLKRLKGNRVLSEHYFGQHSITKGNNDLHREKPLYAVCLLKQVHGCFWFD
jgi:hypothetical protein